MKTRLVILCAAALVLLLAAAGAQAASVEKVELTPPGPSFVDAGAELELDAVLTPPDAGVALTWTSSRPQFATVRKLDDDTCVVQGKAMGRTYVYAKVGGKTVAQRFVTVTAPKASSIKLNTKSVTLNPGGAKTYSTYQLKATTTPTYHSDSVEWKSDDESIATVSETGLVTAVSDGSETRTCTVTATLAKSKKSVSCKITVKKIPDKYVRMPTSVVVPYKSARPLSAVVYPANAFDKTVTWEVIKGPQFVKLTDNGNGKVLIEGVKRGTAILRAKPANGRAASCAVTVKLVRYSSLSVTPSSKTVKKGGSYEIKLKRAPTYVSYPDVAITSRNKDVADVALTDEGKWMVTGTGRGYATLDLTADNGRINRKLSVRVMDYENPVTVTVSAIGDVMLGGDPRKGKGSFTRFDDLWKKHGAGYFFAKIKGQLKGVVFANLEIPLIDTSNVANGSRSYIFRGKTTYARALKQGGIDAVDLDNNHIMDYGSRGYSSTRSAVSGQGVASFGLGKVSYITRNGVKIGFVGFRPENISISKMKSSVKAVRSRCDVVIASFHWGTGYSPTGQQVAYGRAAVDAGADLVVGHHSHLVSGIELYKGKHIVYGLGTIVSAVKRPDDVDTFIYQHTFSVKGTTVSNDGFKIVPVLMTNNGKGSANDAQPVFGDNDDDKRILKKIKSYSPSRNPF